MQVALPRPPLCSRATRSRARRSVLDGCSPKRRRYSAENLPRWWKPYRRAISVIEPGRDAWSSSSRKAARRIPRRYPRGETPRKARKCFRSVRAPTPDRRLSSAMATGWPTWSRMYAIVFLTSCGSTIGPLAGPGRFTGPAELVDDSAVATLRPGRTDISATLTRSSAQSRERGCIIP